MSGNSEYVLIGAALGETPRGVGKVWILLPNRTSPHPIHTTPLIAFALLLQIIPHYIIVQSLLYTDLQNRPHHYTFNTRITPSCTPCTRYSTFTVPPHSRPPPFESRVHIVEHMLVAARRYYGLVAFVPAEAARARTRVAATAHRDIVRLTAADVVCLAVVAADAAAWIAAAPAAACCSLRCFVQAGDGGARRHVLRVLVLVTGVHLLQRQHVQHEHVHHEVGHREERQACRQLQQHRRRVHGAEPPVLNDEDAHTVTVENSALIRELRKHGVDVFERGVLQVHRLVCVRDLGQRS